MAFERDEAVDRETFRAQQSEAAEIGQVDGEVARLDRGDEIRRLTDPRRQPLDRSGEAARRGAGW